MPCKKFAEAPTAFSRMREHRWERILLTLPVTGVRSALGMSDVLKSVPVEVLPPFRVSHPAIEYPLSTLARHDTGNTLAFLRRAADQQFSLERHRINANVEIARITAGRDVEIARESTKQTRVNAYSSIVIAAIQHSESQTLRRVRITEDRGGFFSSCVFRLTAEFD